MKKLFQHVAVKTSTVPQTEEGSEFYQQEERLVDTKNMYKQLLKMSKVMNTQLQACPTSQQELAQYWQSVGQKDDGLLGQTMLKYAEVLKSLSIMCENLTFLINEDFINPVANTLVNEIKSAKAIQKRLDDARLEYDSKRAKVANMKPGDAKIQAEEELQAAKQHYDNLKSEMTAKFNQIEHLRKTDLLHQVSGCMKAFHKYFSDGKDLLEELSPHWKQLEEQVPRGDDNDAKSIEVELNLLRMQRAPQTCYENMETNLQEEVRILEEEHQHLVELYGPNSDQARAVVGLAQTTRQRLDGVTNGSVIAS